MSPQPTRELNMKLIVGALAVVVGFGVFAYLAGEALTLLATGHFTGTRVTAAPGIGFLLIPHIYSPAEAWPATSRPVMSEGAFWVVWGVLIGAVIALVLRHVESAARILKGRSAPPDAALFATKRDLSRLVVARPTPGRLTLGTTGRTLLAAEPRQSLLVMGPTQTGKTTALAVPVMLEHDGPILATSVKNDLLIDTLAVRRQKGEVFVFDPAEVNDMHRRHQWTPLARCGTFDGAQKTAKSLVMTAKQALGGAGENGFWYDQAQTLMGPLLYAAALGGKDISAVLHWLDIQEKDQVRAELISWYDGLDDMPLSTLEGIWSMGNEQRDSVYLTARGVVQAYRSPSVLDSARKSEISPEKLLNGGANTAYLCAPITEQEELASIYATLIKEIIDYAYQEYAKTGQPLDPPLLVVLDEAANIAPLPDLNKIASTAAGVGIQLVTVFQDLGQVRERWGHDKAQTIVSNHRATAVLSGIKCEHTLKWIADVTGEQEVTQVSFTDGHQSKSSTESQTYRRILPSNVVREMKTNTGLLIYGNIPPVRLDLRPWYADPVMKNLIEKAKLEDPVRIDPRTGERFPELEFGPTKRQEPIHVDDLSEEDAEKLAKGRPITAVVERDSESELQRGAGTAAVVVEEDVEPSDDEEAAEEISDEQIAEDQESMAVLFEDPDAPDFEDDDESGEED